MTEAESTSRKNIKVNRLLDRHISQSHTKKFSKVVEKSNAPTEEKCIVRVETTKNEA